MEWIENLKAGDKVIVKGYGSNRSEAIKIVVRTTKSQIVVGKDYEVKYRKTNGKQIGSDLWSGSYINEWTQEEDTRIRKMIRRSNIVRLLRNHDWSKVSNEDLEKIYLIVKGVG